MKLNNSYQTLPADFYRKELPDKIAKPQLLQFNQQLASELGFTKNYSDNELAQIFCGNELLANSKPIATAYAGHQFGQLVPQLGDGRAVLLGNLSNKKGKSFELQLKGSGRTTFSRSGDGKCPLGAAIKEYIFSEALHYLKVPTTRALALVNINEAIRRETFLPAAIVTRVATSHIRVGTFEYFAYRQDTKNLKILADYTINLLYPECTKYQNPYLQLLKKTLHAQAKLVSKWQALGFIHGVMNTDNTSLAAETIDYGPAAFMDQFNTDQVFSYIDQYGRYRYSNQPEIILWNLGKFAESLLPLLNDNMDKAITLAEKTINKFPQIFMKYYVPEMCQKLGIFNASKADLKLVQEFLAILEKEQLDFTNSFRNLSKILLDKAAQKPSKTMQDWQKKWLERLTQEIAAKEEIAKKLEKINPILIPRNHYIEHITQQAMFRQNYQPLNEFLELIKRPFNENTAAAKYYQAPTTQQKVPHTFCGT